MLIKEYTTLKEFSEGINKLYKAHGDIPVFVAIDDLDNNDAPFGMALHVSTLDGKPDRLVLFGVSKKEINFSGH